VLFAKHYYSDQLKEDEIAGACSTHREEVQIKFRSKLRGQDGSEVGETGEKH
jgi:hypothetical protein